MTFHPENVSVGDRTDTGDIEVVIGGTEAEIDDGEIEERAAERTVTIDAERVWSLIGDLSSALAGADDASLLKTLSNGEDFIVVRHLGSGPLETWYAPAREMDETEHVVDAVLFDGATLAVKQRELERWVGEGSMEAAIRACLDRLGVLAD